MRRVDKERVDIPETLLSEICSISFDEVINTEDPQHREKINREIYSAPDVKSVLSILYYNKCAYCETFDPEYQIEHYRPKKGVNGIKHIGYYWLCYEWTNLLPACYHCNKPGNKGNHFRIKSEHRRVKMFTTDENMKLNSVTLSATEKPLLLNPEEPDFDPGNYFKFNYGCEMKESRTSGTFEFERAKYTIQTIDLNRESILREIRQKGVKELKGKFLQILLMRDAGKMDDGLFNEFAKSFLDDLHSKGDEREAYSFWWRSLLNNFKTLFTKRFSQYHQKILGVVYDKYQAGVL